MVFGALLLLILLPMCEYDPTSTNSGITKLTNKPSPDHPLLKSHSVRVQYVFGSIEYMDFLRSWIDVCLSTNKIYKNCSDGKEQKLIAIANIASKRIQTNESELTALIGKENFGQLKKVAETFTKKTKVLIEVFPEVASFSADELNALAELSSDSGMIPFELFAPQTSLIDPATNSPTNGGGIQECLDAAASSYRSCITTNLIALGIGTIFTLLGGPVTWVTEISVITGALTTTYFNEQCYQSYMRDVDLCIAR